MNRFQSSEHHWTDMVTEMRKVLEVFRSEDNHSDDCTKRSPTTVVHQQMPVTSPMSNHQPSPSSPLDYTKPPCTRMQSVSNSLLVNNDIIYSILKHIKTVTRKCLQANCPTMVDSHGALIVHHLQRHHRRPYLCLAKQCKQTFETRSILKTHLLQEHPSDTSWICKSKHKLKCKLEIGELDKIILHQKLFHEEGQFRCDYGGCHFATQSIRWPVVEHFLQQHVPATLENFN